MNRESKVQKNPEVVARQLAEPGGAVLLHLETGAYHGLNQVGLAVWDLIDGERTVADLIEALRAQVRDAPPEVEQDVIGFVESAVERDLVRLAD